MGEYHWQQGRSHFLVRDFARANAFLGLNLCNDAGEAGDTAWRSW
jgi:hypothetical protein